MENEWFSIFKYLDTKESGNDIGVTSFKNYIYQNWVWSHSTPTPINRSLGDVTHKYYCWRRLIYFTNIFEDSPLPKHEIQYLIITMNVRLLQVKHTVLVEVFRIRLCVNYKSLSLQAVTSLLPSPSLTRPDSSGQVFLDFSGLTELTKQFIINLLSYIL